MEHALIDGHSVLGLIPARMGSKGLPGKNWRDLLGKPLVAWTIEQALAAAVLDEVHVSTDSAHIADIAESCGAAVPYIRPASLATDQSTTVDVALHALERCSAAGRSFDYLALLEPTSPLRGEGDIDRAVTSLHQQSQSFDGLVTLGHCPTHPAVIKRMRGDVVAPFYPGIESESRRQDLTKAYAPFVLCFAVKTDTLRRERTFYPSRLMGLGMGRWQSFEIDDIFDFMAVEAAMKYAIENQLMEP